MGPLALLLSSVSLLAPQQPAPAPAIPKVPALLPEVVLAADQDPVPLAAFGLGSGGIDERVAPGPVRWEKGGCVTPGGVEVECRPVGVKLTFPSGRELLVASDGHLHLRTGEVAGPFPAGLELRLGDGSSVRVLLSPSHRDRLRDVLVVDGERILQPWRRGQPATEVERPSHWGGVRVACCGDGGDLYRAVAIGPLVVLDRVLVPESRRDATPPLRLVVLTAPLVQSLGTMAREHRQSDLEVRRAVGAVAAVVDRREQIFPAGASLQRAEKDRLRWLLRGGYELQLDLEGQRAPRLALFAGRSSAPMVEWALLGNAAVFLNNPRDGQPGGDRWHGNGTRLPRMAEELQIRAELFEAAYALQLLHRLRR